MTDPLKNEPRYNPSFSVVDQGGATTASSPDGVTWTAREMPAKPWAQVSWGDSLWQAWYDSLTRWQKVRYHLRRGEPVKSFSALFSGGT